MVFVKTENIPYFSVNAKYFLFRSFVNYAKLLMFEMKSQLKIKLVGTKATKIGWPWP